MKKYILLSLLLITVICTTAVDADYGASIDSFIGLNANNNSYLFGFEKVSVYSSVKLSEKTSFAFDGFYKFSYKNYIKESLTDESFNIFDLTTFLLSTKAGKVDVQLGRTYMADYSGDILSNTLDGFLLSIPFLTGTLYGNAGYSGMIHREEYSLIKTIQDENDDSERNRVRLLIGGIDFVKDFEDLTFWTSIYSSQDLRPENFSKNFTAFFGGGIQGLILTDIYYSLRGNMKTGFLPYYDTVSGSDLKRALILSGMGALSINWYLQGIDNKLIKSLSPSLSLDFGMSSGDPNLKSHKLGDGQGDISGTSVYSPLVSTGPGIIYSTSNINLTYIKIVASAVPYKSLQAQLESAMFFRTVEGPSGSEDVNIASSGNYLGTEVSLSVNYRPFSDLGMSVSGGFFLPNGSVMTTSDPTWITTAYVSVSL